MSRKRRRQEKRVPKHDPAAAAKRAEVAIAAGDWPEAARAYQLLVRMRPDIPEAWSDLGSILLMLGDAAPAREALMRAVELAPNSADALSNLANLERQTGDGDAALALYRRVLELEPTRANTWHEIARIKRFEAGDPDIDAIEELAATLGSDSAGAMHAAFALGKAYEDTGAYDRAFENLLRANRLKRDGLDYDPGATVRIVDDLIRTFDPAFLMSHMGMGADDARPILVIGMPRSGTSLVEQILAAHSQIGGAGEVSDLEEAAVARLPRFPGGIAEAKAEVFKGIGTDYAARLRRLTPETARTTDKMPSNFLFVGLLAAALPNAKVIHCVRSPMDTCVSCFALHFPYGQPFSYDLAELGGYYRQYRRLMDHWNRVLPGRVLDIVYEDLVADPEAESRRLVAHCGLEWEDACLDFHNQDRLVATASAGQVRQPIYKRSVARWQRFEDHLGPLRDALGDYADAPPATGG